ncbi:MAG: hypothetical protein LBQ90_03720 [Synergistaceae bacterium]|jgi:hypothetical protein|nr:hypothetical protein [Synergistaceae bacterium]
MAAIENAYRSNVSLKLNSGVNPVTENVIVKSCSLGKVVHGADSGKIMDVATALFPLLEYPVLRVERTEVTVLENA